MKRYNPFIKAISVAWQELTSQEAKDYYQRRAREDRERLAAIRNELVAIAKDIRAIVDEFRKEPETEEVECTIVGQLNPVAEAPSMVQRNNERWILQNIPVFEQALEIGNDNGVSSPANATIPSLVSNSVSSGTTATATTAGESTIAAVASVARKRRTTSGSRHSRNP